MALVIDCSLMFFHVFFTAAKPAPPAPAAPAPVPAMAPQQSSGGGGMMSGIIQGMQFGVGSAIANRAVDAVMGPRTMNVEHTNVPAAAPAAGTRV